MCCRVLLVTALLVFFSCCCFHPASGAFDLYCGDKSCYEVLELTTQEGREFSPTQIKKAFYRLSLVHHPDKAVDREASQQLYQEIINAYEVLSLPESRQHYHDFLDHPHRYSNHIRYYQHQLRTHQVSPYKVIFYLLLIASAGHYLYTQHRYKQVRKQLGQHPQIEQRIQAAVKQQMMEELGHIDHTQIAARVNRERTHHLDRYIVITGSEAQPASVKTLLPILLCKGGVKLLYNIFWYLRYQVWYVALGRPFGVIEQQYATSQALNISWQKWCDLLNDAQRQELLERQLWIQTNLQEWRLEKKQEMAAQKRSWR